MYGHSLINLPLVYCFLTLFSPETCLQRGAVVERDRSAGTSSDRHVASDLRRCGTDV